jgi:hypothetical protein
MLLAALLTLLAFKRLHVLFVLGMLLFGRSAARLRVTKAKLAAAVLFFALSPILLLPGVSSGLIERALPQSDGAAIILERLDDFSTGAWDILPRFRPIRKANSALGGSIICWRYTVPACARCTATCSAFYGKSRPSAPLCLRPSISACCAAAAIPTPSCSCAFCAP